MHHIHILEPIDCMFDLVLSVQSRRNLNHELLKLFLFEELMTIDFFQTLYSFDTIWVISKYFVSKFLETCGPNGTREIAEFDIEFVSRNSFLNILITMSTSVIWFCAFPTVRTAFVQPIFKCHHIDCQNQSGSNLLPFLYIRNFFAKLLYVLKDLLFLIDRRFIFHLRTYICFSMRWNPFELIILMIFDNPNL